MSATDTQIETGPDQDSPKISLRALGMLDADDVQAKDTLGTNMALAGQDWDNVQARIDQSHAELKTSLLAELKPKGFWQWLKGQKDSAAYAIAVAGMVFVVHEYIPARIKADTGDLATREQMDAGLTKIETRIDTALNSALDKAYQGLRQTPEAKPGTKKKVGALGLGDRVLGLAKDLNARLDPQTVEHFNEAVSKSLRDYPTIPDAWSTAGQLVSLRSREAQPSLAEKASELPNCLNSTTEGDSTTVISPDGRMREIPGDVSLPDSLNPLARTHLELTGCVLYLDTDPQVFETSAVGKYFQRKKMLHPNISQRYLVLKDSVIVYRGGAIVPVSYLIFEHCVFDVEINSLPPARGRTLTAELMSIKDWAAAKIQIPVS